MGPTVSCHLDVPVFHTPPPVVVPAAAVVIPQAVAPPVALPVIPPAAPPAVPPVVLPATDLTTSALKRPPRIPGLVATNAGFLIPNSIRKKFRDGWTSHIPLTYLTNKGCLLKNKASVNSAQDIMSFDPTTGQVVTTSRTLNDHGELELTFNEWYQVWRRLLALIDEFFKEEFLMWKKHYSFIHDSENRAELWPLYVAYDVEIRRKATQSSIDPSVFAIGVWNDLEARYTAKKVLNLIQLDLKQQTDRFPLSHSANLPSYTPRNPPNTSSFQNLQHSLPENPRSGRCIFCGDRSKTHTSHGCTAACYANGSPCHLSRQEPSRVRISSSGKQYCYAWNGPSGCDQVTCRKGEHLCTLCGTLTHNAQRCDVIA